MSSWVVVAVSGVTNGGKSTLTRQLLKALPQTTRMLSQDDYFWPKESPQHQPCPGGLQHHNWDVITSIDMASFRRDVAAIMASTPQLTESSGDLEILPHEGHAHTKAAMKPVLILDGFLLLADPELVEMCTLCYFLTLTEEQCWQRRITRVYDPPDPPGYFKACVWSMYLDHLQYMKENVPGVVMLDGMQDHLSAVYHDIVDAAGSHKPLPSLLPSDKCSSER